MKNNLIIGLLGCSVVLAIVSAAVTKDGNQRFLAINGLAISFSSAALALVKNDNEIL